MHAMPRPHNENAGLFPAVRHPQCQRVALVRFARFLARDCSVILKHIVARSVTYANNDRCAGLATASARSRAMSAHRLPSVSRAPMSPPMTRR